MGHLGRSRDSRQLQVTPQAPAFLQGTASCSRRPAWLPPAPSLGPRPLSPARQSASSIIKTTTWPLFQGCRASSYRIVSYRTDHHCCVSPCLSNRRHRPRQALECHLRFLSKPTTARQPTNSHNLPTRTVHSNQHSKPSAPTNADAMSVPNSPYLSDSGFSEALTDDPRKCQIVGCYKRHAYAPTRNGFKVYSDFCTKRMSCRCLYDAHRRIGS